MRATLQIYKDGLYFNFTSVKGSTFHNGQSADSDGRYHGHLLSETMALIDSTLASCMSRTVLDPCPPL